MNCLQLLRAMRSFIQEAEADAEIPQVNPGGGSGIVPERVHTSVPFMVHPGSHFTCTEPGEIPYMGIPSEIS